MHDETIYTLFWHFPLSLLLYYILETFTTMFCVHAYHSLLDLTFHENKHIYQCYEIRKKTDTEFEQNFYSFMLHVMHIMNLLKQNNERNLK
jgi:hypothetical protein